MGAIRDNVIRTTERLHIVGIDVPAHIRPNQDPITPPKKRLKQKNKVLNDRKTSS